MFVTIRERALLIEQKGGNVVDWPDACILMLIWVPKIVHRSVHTQDILNKDSDSQWLGRLDNGETFRIPS